MQKRGKKRRMGCTMATEPKDPFSEFNVNSLSNDWNVPVAKIQEAMRHERKCSYSTMQWLIWLFCEVKHIDEKRLETLFTQATEKEDEKILDRKKTYFDWWFISCPHPIAQRARDNLSRLLVPVQLVSDEVPHEISFQQFLKTNREWDDVSQSYVWFRDECKNALIQRVQLSGNCYIHGPVVALRYAMCKFMDNPPTVDIRKFILQNLHAHLLSKLICNVGGGSSREIFKILLGPQPQLIQETDPSKICQYIRMYGPGLVCNFSVERAFRINNDKRHFSGSFTSDVEGSHSMVVVGYRHVKTENDKVRLFLLLQNWWQRRQFIEIDEPYFRDSEAVVLFTAKNLTNFPMIFDSTMAEYAEADVEFGDDELPEET